MPKTCIICGGRAGSREHVFPAALGGRRTNKGIYCGAHNRGFSPLAKIVAAQMKVINALLAVRPDHSDQAEPLAYTSPTGEQLTIFKGAVERNNPASAQSRDGLHVELSFGKLEGLRAIAYIALTFFAHHFQSHARRPELQAIKNYVLGNDQDTFVWWESVDAIKALPPNPFEFGHTVALTTSASTGEATVLISLFQSLNFGISLGKLDALADRTVVVFVDPQAESTPNDVREEKHDHVLLDLRKPEPMHAHLEKMIRHGGAQQVLQLLLERIERWKFKGEMARALERLNAARNLPTTRFLEEIRDVVEGEASRIYRLMRHVAAEFAKTTNAKTDNPLAEGIAKFLNATVEEAHATASGLSSLAELSITIAVTAIIKELAAKLHQDVINMDYLWQLFSGGLGAGIVGEVMSAPIKNYLGGGDRAPS